MSHSDVNTSNSREQTLAMFSPRYLYESIKSLLNGTLSKLGYKDSSASTPARPTWDKWGFNMILVDSVTSTPEKVYPQVYASFTPEDLARSIVFTDQKIHYASFEHKPKQIGPFDQSELDTWILAREADPSGTAFVFIDSFNGTLSEDASVRNLISKMDSINTAVYMAVPLDRALNAALVLANKVYMFPKQRKVPVVERIRIYNLLFKEMRSSVTYKSFIEDWHDNLKGNKAMLIDGGNYSFV